MSNRLPRNPSAPRHREILRAHRFFESLHGALHKEWLKHLSQPELLRIGLLSEYWRALAVKEPRYYLAARLEGVSEPGVEIFIQQLGGAVARKLPIGIYLDLDGPSIAECATSAAECDTLAEKVSPAIERSMPHVRKLSIVSGSPLPPATVEFLQAPAPELREFVFNIDMDTDTDRFGGSKYYARLMEDAYKEHVGNLEDILSDLFGCAAKKLTRVHLGGIVLAALPQDPVSAFGAVTRVAAFNVANFPEVGLGEHFPEAKHMELELNESCLEDCEAYAGPAFLPAGLATLDVWTTAMVLCALIKHVDLEAVPDLRIAFDSHFGLEAAGSKARDEAWAGALAARGTQRRLSMFSTSWDEDGMPKDLRVSVSDDTDPRTVVTFYAEDSFYAKDSFGEALYADAPYGPLASLERISTSLTVISIEHAHLQSLFTVATALPALTSFHIALRVSKPLRTAFWKTHRFSQWAVKCPKLSELDLSYGGTKGDVVIPSNELAQFARAIGLTGAHRPRLILRGVTVEGGTLHVSHFCNVDG